MPPDSTTATAWLDAQAAKAPPATDTAFHALYADLRRLAGGHMRRERAGHTLGATALLHEAWFRMAAQHAPEWKNRAHFLAIASTMMRRILVSHAVARRADKRDVELVPLTLSEAEHLGVAQTPDVTALHEALLAFAAIDERAARMVELRFFGGLSNDEVAEVLGISVATVKRDWDLARAWLRRELSSA